MSLGMNGDELEDKDGMEFVGMDGDEFVRTRME